MTNENELKVGDCPLRDDQIVSALSMINTSHVGRVYVDEAINLIKSQQSHIEVLESAIREFLSWTCYKDDEPDYLDALQNLRNLMENSK